jgi:hypothetical protein
MQRYAIKIPYPNHPFFRDKLIEMNL